MHPRKEAFTLVEIMVIVAIIGIVIAIAAPTWLRQRAVTQATSCQENLQKIDQAMEQYALEYRLPSGHAFNFPQDLIHPGGVPMGEGYLKRTPLCPASGDYSAPAIGTDPVCSIGFSNSPFAPHIIQ